MRDHVWEALVPLVWALSVAVIWHSIGAAICLIRNIGNDANVVETDGQIFIPGGARNRVRHTFVPPSRYKFKIWSSASVLIVLPLGASIFVAMLSRQTDAPKETAPLETEIFMECHMISLPVSVPGGRTISVVLMNEKQIEGKDIVGFVTINPGDSERWPDAQWISKAKAIHDMGAGGYRCLVSNHGPVNVLYLSITLDLFFKGGSNLKPFRFTPVIGALDSGRDFEFYIFNDCDTFYTAAWQSEGRVQLFGENVARNIHIWQTGRGDLGGIAGGVGEHLMMFAPNGVSLSGNPCS
jgi:hypothetical protein